ncbi:MAG: YiiX/YebB-like N1pC/P60 family cysteine hydrolase [Cytophagales bacterium]|nr:YiiX/YebB-like N1pC/P60 family cysteine hydrolase [Cytophagales bacterium]
MNFVARKVGGWLSRYLSIENKSARIGTPTNIEALRQCVRPGDVVLVEGNTKFSTAIKYLTQSTWSHTTLYVGTITVDGQTYHEQLIEANVSKGIIHSDLSELAGYHVRICRPIGLTETEIQTLRDYAVSKLGGSYDLRNVFDLVRYFVPVLPFPASKRRELLAFGSGEPTQAICSTLVAEVFKQLRYPILPKINQHQHLSQRDHTLFTPRDFDVSPYFQVIKPTVELGFDFHTFEWVNKPT